MLDGDKVSDYAPVALAALGFLARDIAIFVLMRSFAKARGDFAALAVLAALYLLLPMIVQRLLRQADAVPVRAVPGQPSCAGGLAGSRCGDRLDVWRLRPRPAC